ncbi:hypothetical protein NEAUS05_0731 [Nematocida ausubeli]|nr:hypothetical protein NEAUS07_0666 [Nematocida ausubeli]KAI5147424.1 hypothetical protein NEAUS05_0731 [Nematocida ausubeli]
MKKESISIEKQGPRIKYRAPPAPPSLSADELIRARRSYVTLARPRQSYNESLNNTALHQPQPYNTSQRDFFVADNENDSSAKPLSKQKRQKRSSRHSGRNRDVPCICSPIERYFSRIVQKLFIKFIFPLQLYISLGYCIFILSNWIGIVMIYRVNMEEFPLLTYGGIFFDNTVIAGAAGLLIYLYSIMRYNYYIRRSPYMMKCFMKMLTIILATGMIFLIIKVINIKLIAIINEHAIWPFLMYTFILLTGIGSVLGVCEKWLLNCRRSKKFAFFNPFGGIESFLYYLTHFATCVVMVLVTIFILSNYNEAKTQKDFNPKSNIVFPRFIEELPFFFSKSFNETNILYDKVDHINNASMKT